MKLRRDDKVMVIAGKDHGKVGKIIAVLPQKNQVIVEGVNVVKRHTKPSQSNPKGGVLEITKPIAASNVMIIDPKTSRPARIGYIVKSGRKERILKVSKFKNPKKVIQKGRKS